MEPVDVFNSMEYLEKKCPKCGLKVDFGVTTNWSDEKDGHVCNGCGEKVE